MQFQDNSFSIGRTPLVKLNRVVDGSESDRARQTGSPESCVLGERPHRRGHGLGR